MGKHIEIVQRKVGDLRLDFGNPRKIKKQKRDDLEESLEKYGDFDIIVINEENQVIGGNQRVTIENARRKYGTSDYAIAAMCSGYDAIKVHVSGSEDYYVVLNRAAMVMEDPVDSLANMAIAASERNAAKKSSS